MKWYDIIILFYVIVDKIQDVVIMAYDYDDDDDDDYPVKWSRNGMEWHDMIWYDMEWNGMAIRYDDYPVNTNGMLLWWYDPVNSNGRLLYMEWNGMIQRYDTIRYDMMTIQWKPMALYDLIYSMTWIETIIKMYVCRYLPLLVVVIDDLLLLFSGKGMNKNDNNNNDFFLLMFFFFSLI